MQKPRVNLCRQKLMGDPFPKFTSCSFSDETTPWLPSLHFCTKEGMKHRVISRCAKFVGVVTIKALAFLIGLRRWAFLWNSIL